MSSNRAKIAATPEQSQVAAISAVAESVRATAGAAATAYDQARQAHAAASAALTEAETRYVADPDDGEGVHVAERSLRLSEVRLEAAKKRHEEAVRAVEGATSALAAATLDAKKNELAEQSTPDALASAIRAPWGVFLSAYEALEQAANEIGDALKRSHNASAELRSLGTYERDLDPLHAILPALNALASKGVVVSDLDGVRPSRGIAAASLVAFLSAFDASAPIGHQEAFRAKLTRIRATRTAFDVSALEQKEAGGLAFAAMAQYRQPATGRPAGLAPPAPAVAAELPPPDASMARRSSAPSRRERDERE